MNDNNKLTMDDNQNQQNQNANSTPTDNRGDSDSFDEQSQPGQPLDQPSSEQPYVNQPKRTRKKLVFIAVLLVIMILSGFGGAGIYYYFNKASKDQVVANDQSSQTNTDKASLTPAMITDQVKKAIAEVYPVVDDVDNTKLVNNQVSFKSSDEAPAWMVNNSKNYVRYSGNGASSTLVYINNNSGNIEKENLRVVEIQIGQIRRIMVDVLKGNNFALVTDNAYAKGDLFDAYQRDDVLCVAFKLNE